jgi:sigma-B regulation protein RsbU (phosphoserine phosphatase)
MFIGNQMAIAIDRLLRKEREQLNRILSIDQELARKVQARTAPWKLPQWPELQLAVLSEPGTGACTDFYDVLPLGDKQGMILFGQTAPGANDTAICISEVSASFRIGAVHRDVPQVLMRQMNWLLFTTGAEPRQISAGLISIDPQSGEFYLCLAGEVHAFLVGTSGKVVKVKNPGNPLLGESRKAKYEAVKGKLGPEQTLILCTGGIFGVSTGNGSFFTEEHLVDLLSDSFGQVPARILGDLADDITAFSGGAKPQRDITLLLLRKGRSLSQD